MKSVRKRAGGQNWHRLLVNHSTYMPLFSSIESTEFSSDAQSKHNMYLTEREELLKHQSVHTFKVYFPCH